MDRLCLCGCGQPIISTRRDGDVVTYIKGHKNGNVPTAAECGHCTKAILVPVYRINKFGTVYCSRECAHKQRSLQALVDFVCENCGSLFKKKGSRRQCVHVYCSLRCFNLHKISIETRPIVTCETCKKSFPVYPSKKKKNRFFYCSIKCRAQHIRGATNPAFTTGVGRRGLYGKNWKSQRRAALARDDSRCVLCLIVPKKPHVHHIKEIAHFKDDYENGNRLENLITLCNPCHINVHFDRVCLL